MNTNDRYTKSLVKHQQAPVKKLPKASRFYPLKQENTLGLLLNFVNIPTSCLEGKSSSILVIYANVNLKIFAANQASASFMQ